MLTLKLFRPPFIFTIEVTNEGLEYILVSAIADTVYINVDQGILIADSLVIPSMEHLLEECQLALIEIRLLPSKSCQSGIGKMLMISLTVVPESRMVLERCPGSVK